MLEEAWHLDRSISKNCCKNPVLSLGLSQSITGEYFQVRKQNTVLEVSVQGMGNTLVTFPFKTTAGDVCSMPSIDWGLLASDIAYEKDLKSKLHDTFKSRTNKMLNEFQLVKTYGRFSVLSSLSLFANKCAFVLRLFFTQWLQMSIILTLSPWWTYSPIKSHQIMCQV